MATFTLVSDSGSQAGKATVTTLLELGFFTLSAVKDDAEDLKLIGWSTGGDTVLRRADSDEQAGFVDEISMSRNAGLTVTAVRDGGHNMKLISWDDHTDVKSITRLNDSGDEPGGATLIAIANVSVPSEANLITAHRTGGGHLKLISWRIRLDGTLIRLQDSGDQEAVDLVALTALRGAGDIFVTAVRDASNSNETIADLRMITWRVLENGTITRLATVVSAQDRNATEISIAGSVTAVRDVTGNLNLINWGIPPDGSTITRLAASGQVGQATHIALSQFSSKRYLTAFRSVTGVLRLMAFDVDPLGPVTQVGDSGELAGLVQDEKITLTTPQFNKLATGATDVDGNLRVMSWTMT